MTGLIEHSGGTGAGGMPPVTAPTPKTIAFLEETQPEVRALIADLHDTTSNTAPTIIPPIDEATASAVEQTRNAFFRVRDAGETNRIQQGQLLLLAQEQLAQYGSGTFTTMLLAPRPAGFGFKSTTSAYDLIDEAKGKPKRSHKRKGTGTVSTPGRVNEAPPLTINVEGDPAPDEESVVPEDLPVTLDTSHTHLYVAFSFPGVYVPKEHVAGFTVWLKQVTHAALSCQFLAWYQAENPSGEEVCDAANSTIQ